MSVYNTATVRVSAAVDGGARRRRVTKRAKKPQPVQVIRVRNEVMKVVRAIRRPGEQLVIVSETEVWLRHLKE